MESYGKSFPFVKNLILCVRFVLVYCIFYKNFIKGSSKIDIMIKIKNKKTDRWYKYFVKIFFY